MLVMSIISLIYIFHYWKSWICNSILHTSHYIKCNTNHTLKKYYGIFSLLIIINLQWFLHARNHIKHNSMHACKKNIIVFYAIDNYNFMIIFEHFN